MNPNETSTTQAENAAGAVVAHQGAIQTAGPSGNAVNDAGGLPMDFDAIDGAMFGGQPIEVASSAIAPAPAPAAPVVIPPAGDQTPLVQVTNVPAAVESAPEPTGPGVGERIIPGRISTGQFSQATQRAMSLMHQLNDGKPEGTPGTVTMEVALGMVRQADGGQPIQIPQAAPVVTEPPPPTQAEVIRGEVADLEAQIRQSGANQDLFGPELAEATIALADKKAALRVLEAGEAQQQRQTVDQHIAARESVKSAVIAEFKGADDPRTFLGARVAARIDEMSDPAHPEHRDLSRTDAPRLVVERAAKEVAANLVAQFGMTEAAAMASLRVASSAPAQPVQPGQLPPVAGNRNVKLAPGATTTGAPAPAMTEAQILAASMSDPDAYDSALGYRSTFHIGT